MNCAQIQSLLAAYLDGEVTLSEKTLIQAHLSDCTACQQEFILLSTARSRVRTMLQQRAIHAEPSQQTWTQLEARLTKAAQPSLRQQWLSRLAPGISRTMTRFFSGGVPMQKRSILAGGMAFVAIAVVAVLIFNSVIPVSAQQILTRASAAQAAMQAGQGQGIGHTLVKVYENPKALDDIQAGTTTTMETYTDAATGNYRFTKTDAQGKLLEISADDGALNYFMMRNTEEINNPLIIHRIPRSKDDIRKALAATDSSDMKVSLFEHYKTNPRVELVGKEDQGGRQVYVLIDRNFQTSKLPNGESQNTFTGTMQMVFDAQTYALLESQTTVFRNNKEIVIEKVEFLVDETLPAKTQVTWNLSDLQNASFVDDQVQTEQAEALPVPISQEELSKHRDTYVLNAIPSGFIQKIVAAPNQPEDQPYTYEVNYDSAAGENFGLQAVGFMDDGFVETNFYDGSYKTSNGMTLYYSSGTPENSPKGTSAMLVTPDGASFLTFSTMSRAQVQTLVEGLVQLK